MATRRLVDKRRRNILRNFADEVLQNREIVVLTVSIASSEAGTAFSADGGTSTGGTSTIGTSTDGGTYTAVTTARIDDKCHLGRERSKERCCP